MPALGSTSVVRLASCDQRLQDLVRAVADLYNITVICGHRNEREQDEAFKSGNSKLQWPKSKHNSLPSKAVDIMPFPVDYNDAKRMYFMLGLVVAESKRLGIKIRIGADFDGDFNFKNNKFVDVPHIELSE